MSEDGTEIERPKSFNLVMVGSTPGAAPNESVELVGGIGQFISKDLLTPNVHYHVEVDAKVSGIDTGTNVKSTGVGIINKATIWTDGTTLFVDGIGIPSFADGAADNGNAHPANWAIVGAHAAGPERYGITFSTGAGVTNKVNVVADVSVTAGAPVPPV